MNDGVIYPRPVRLCSFTRPGSTHLHHDKINIENISPDEIEHDFSKIQSKVEGDSCHDEIMNIFYKKKPYDLNNEEIQKRMQMIRKEDNSKKNYNNQKSQRAEEK